MTDRDRRTDRQTDRQRRADRQTYRLTETETERETERDKQKEKQGERDRERKRTALDSQGHSHNKARALIPFDVCIHGSLESMQPLNLTGRLQPRASFISGHAVAMLAGDTAQIELSDEG